MTTIFIVSSTLPAQSLQITCIFLYFVVGVIRELAVDHAPHTHTHTPRQLLAFRPQQQQQQEPWREQWRANIHKQRITTLNAEKHQLNVADKSHGRLTEAHRIPSALALTQESCELWVRERKRSEVLPPGRTAGPGNRCPKTKTTKQKTRKQIAKGEGQKQQLGAFILNHSHFKAFNWF